jgi:hypothetical protein
VDHAGRELALDDDRGVGERSFRVSEEKLLALRDVRASFSRSGN